MSSLQQATLLWQAGQRHEAVALCQALSLDAGHARDALTLLAEMHVAAGDSAAASKLLQQATERWPSDASLHRRLGNLRLAAGAAQAAIESYRMALEIEPASASAWNNLGQAQLQLDQLDAAVVSFECAVKAEASHALAHNNLGTALRRQGKTEDALLRYFRAAALKPTFAEALCNAGQILLQQQRPEDALPLLERAVTCKPTLVEALAGRADAYRQLKQFERALEAYRQALALSPDHVQVLCNCASVLLVLGRPHEAVQYCDRALERASDLVEAHNNRGIALAQLGQHDAALLDFDAAIDLRPDYAEAHCHRAFVWLVHGELERGWVEQEWRYRNPGSSAFQARYRFTQPLWSGAEAIAGKTVLLHAEQGFGDTLQFCRYATLVADRGAQVLIEVPAALRGIAGSLSGVSLVLTRGEALPAFDYHCSLMSLPAIFGTTLNTIPARVPYLRAAAEQVDAWRRRLGATHKLRVGMVWAGGFRADQPALWEIDRRRNIPLRLLGSLQHPDIEFHSLQKGEAAESELQQLAESSTREWHLADHAADLDDFADTAALIEALDLIISVDTSTAHLAGALGKPLWILNRFDTCWRWLLDRTDSSWYPTARLYRQERFGDWGGVIERVQTDLFELVARHVRS
jgi:tetratricopeptide (TPR) repeat protein